MQKLLSGDYSAYDITRLQIGLTRAACGDRGIERANHIHDLGGELKPVHPCNLDTGPACLLGRPSSNKKAFCLK